MTAIGKGDWVEYIGVPPDIPDHLRVGPSLKKGSIWRVAACGEYCGLMWILCEGQAHPGDIDPAWRHVPGWDARQYRPIYRPSSSTLIADLMKTPQTTDPVTSVGYVMHVGFCVLDIDGVGSFTIDIA